MLIESRTIVGASAALAIVGAMLWGATMLAPAPTSKHGKVEVSQVEDRSWSVEVKDVGFQPAAEPQKTAAITR